MWMVRNNGGEYAEEFKDQSIVAVGWKAAGNLKGLSRDQIVERVQQAWPNYRSGQVFMAAIQLDKITNEMKIGESVLTYDPSKRTYFVGKIAGEYEYNQNAEDILANRRKVRWESEIERDKLTVPTKNSLGSSLTIFELSEKAEHEIATLVAGRKLDTPAEAVSSNEADADVEVILDDIQSKAREFIKDKVARLDWDDVQDLVAGVLRAMGYKTRVSPQGSDRGRDIIASPDGFGFEQPRIVVEVKHRNHQIGSAEIRSYLGGRHKDDRGLYVSTGGFSKDAKYEADRASIPLTLMDIDELVEAVIENY